MKWSNPQLSSSNKLSTLTRSTNCITKSDQPADPNCKPRWSEWQTSCTSKKTCRTWEARAKREETTLQTLREQTSTRWCLKPSTLPTSRTLSSKRPGTPLSTTWSNLRPRTTHLTTQPTPGSSTWVCHSGLRLLAISALLMFPMPTSSKPLRESKPYLRRETRCKASYQDSL